MEKELNYLSEKIESLERNITLINERFDKSTEMVEELISNENELELLRNILNSVTISELNK